MPIVKASETKYAQQFDALIGDILAGTAVCNVEIPWLTEFLCEKAFHDCDFVAYHAASFNDWGFSDEGIRDNHYPENIEITDALRVLEGRTYLAGLTDDDTCSMFDPGFFDFQVQASSGQTITIVIGFCAEGHALGYYFMGGFSVGTTLELANALGYLTSEQLEEVSDDWILGNWRRDP